MTRNTILKPGDRVRMLVSIPSATWLPKLRPDIPAGWEGTVTHVHVTDYSVLLDDVRFDAPVVFDADEIESVDG